MTLRRSKVKVSRWQQYRLDGNQRSASAGTSRKKNDTIPLAPLGLLCAGLIAESVNEESFKQMEELLSITHSGNTSYLLEPKVWRPTDNVCKPWLRHPSGLWGSPLEDRVGEPTSEEVAPCPEHPELRPMVLGRRYALAPGIVRSRPVVRV